MIYKSDALRKAEERLAQKIREKEEEEKRKRNSVVYAPAENNSVLKQAEMRMAEQINALETEKQRQRSAVYQPQEKSFDALRREAEQKTAQERLQKRQQKRQAASLDAPYWTVQDALDTVQQRREAEGTQEKKTFRDILRNGLLNTSAQQEEVQKRTAKTADALAKTFVAGQTAKTMWDSGQASWWQWPARMVRNAREWAENSEPDSKIMQSTRDFAVEKVFEPFQESKIGQKLEAFVDEGYAKNEKADALVSLLDDGTLGGDAKVFLARLAEAAPALTNEVLLAMGTMGGSVPTTAARLASKAGRILNAAHTVWTSAKSPVTAIRALRYLNEEYENALANGADEGEALKSALLYALPSALIESSGGIDAVAREVASGQLRSGAGRFLRDLLTRTAVQEGGEEAAQTVLQNLAQGAAYDRERQLFSLTDESAVINPRSIAQSFLYGYAGGVLLGGVTGGADLALRRVRSGEARAALKSEVTRQAEAAGVQLTQAETEAMTDAVTAELMRELGETSNNVAWRRDPNAPQPGANVTAAALARMEGAAAGEAEGAAAGAERIGRAGASDAGVFWPVNRRDSRPPRAVGDSEPAPHRTVAETLPGAAETGVRDAETLLSAVPEGAETRAGESWTGTQERIGAWIKKQGGPEGAKSRLLQTKGELTATEIGAAQELARYYAAQGDTSATADMVGVFLEGATDLGRALNYIKTLNRDTPEGFLLALERMIRRDGGEELSAADKADILLVQKWAQQGGRLDETDAAQASASLQKWLKEATAYAERGWTDVEAVAAAKAVNIAASHQKSTARQQFRTMQRISMLSNLKTFLRNYLGTGWNVVSEAINSPIAYGVDALLKKKTGQSTYSADVLGTLKAFTRGAIRGTKQSIADYRLGVDTLGDRYHEGLKAQTPAFDAVGARTGLGRRTAAFFNAVDDLIGFMLSVGDAWALVGSYESAKYQMMRANGLSEPTAEIIDAAWRHAERMTFRDNNGLTRRIEAIRNLGGLAGDATAPFVKSPVNVIKVSMEYSPIGVVEAVGKALFGKSSLKATLERGDSTLNIQRDIAELMGRGLISPALMLLGAFLGRAGVISGDGEDNAKERYYQQMLGRMENSILMGNKLYDISFLQLQTTPIMAGAAIGADLKDGEIDWAAMLQAAQKVGNTALDMPVLQGVQDLLSNNASPESIMLGLFGLAVESATDAMPFSSLLRQTAAALDPYARSTAAPDKNAAARILTEVKNNIMYKIPGLRERLPMRYDTLGNPMMNDASETTAERIFNAYLNPFNSSRLQETDVTRGIDELYAATQDRSVLPRSAPYDVAADGMRYDLSGEERQEFQRIQGQTSNDALAAAFALDSFQDASPELQQDIVEAIYDYATDRAKDDFLTGRGVAYESAVWMEKTRELAEAGISEGEAIVYRKVFQDMEEDAQARGLSGKETNREIRDYIKSLPLSEQEKEALDKAFVSDLTIIPQEYDVDYGSDESFLLTQMSSAAQKKWERARDWGMSAEEYGRYYPLAASSKKKAERIADLIAAGMSEEQAQYFYRLITSK